MRRKCSPCCVDLPILWTIIVQKKCRPTAVLPHMSVFNFLCTDIGTFWLIATPPNWSQNFETCPCTTFLLKVNFALAHHISFSGCTCSPHFFSGLHLLTTILLTVALAHHISFYRCTCSPHLFLLCKNCSVRAFVSHFPCLSQLLGFTPTPTRTTKGCVSA